MEQKTDTVKNQVHLLQLYSMAKGFIRIDEEAS
jgi:hypothetical protein